MLSAEETGIFLQTADVWEDSVENILNNQLVTTRRGQILLVEKFLKGSATAS